MRKVKSLEKTSYPAPDVVTKMVPAPTDGWDAISPLALMDPKRAPILDNWIPRTGFVELRPGLVPYSISVQGADTPVETLMVLRTASAQFMVAGVDGDLVDITIPDATVVIGSGFSNNRWQYTNFKNAGGVAIIQACNGADDLIQWTGSGAVTTPSITGLPGSVTTGDFINIAAIKRRLWYIVNQSAEVIFMPIDAISGAIAGTLDLGALYTKGGYCMAAANWTVDGGDGPNDYTAFVSSRGQVALYSGVDPTDATDWKLVGTFNLSPPISRRCTLGVGSDVALITLQGILPLSQALPFDPSADRSVAITQRIQNAMQTAGMQGQNLFGWQLIAFPAQALAILNVPLTENQQQVQFVMNVLSGAWCRFTGWNANCFEVFNDLLYFGDNDGNVWQAFRGSQDFTMPINLDMQCAFNYFEDPGRLKRMTMIQPLLTVGGLATPTVLVDVDFASDDVAAPLSLLQGNILWDVAEWDVSLWPFSSSSQTDWYSVEALGHALAIRFKLTLGDPKTAGVFDIGAFDFATFDGVGSGGDSPILQVNAFNAIMEMGGFVG